MLNIPKYSNKFLRFLGIKHYWVNACDILTLPIIYSLSQNN